MVADVFGSSSIIRAQVKTSQRGNSSRPERICTRASWVRGVESESLGANWRSSVFCRGWRLQDTGRASVCASRRFRPQANVESTSLTVHSPYTSPSSSSSAALYPLRNSCLSTHAPARPPPPSPTAASSSSAAPGLAVPFSTHPSIADGIAQTIPRPTHARDSEDRPRKSKSLGTPQRRRAHLRSCGASRLESHPI